ncbi:MAG: Holliday junction resolvase RuvX [Microthrixaceae bacterium]
MASIVAGPVVRAIGLDLGTRRIGVALSNADGTLATPYDVVQRRGDRGAEHRAISRIAEEVEAELVVVGVPYHLDGRLSPGARAALEEAAEIGASTGLPVETYDERLTTVTAQRSLQAMNVSAARRRQAVDRIAASVMLQAWLDRRRLAPDGPGSTGTSSAPDPQDH